MLGQNLHSISYQTWMFLNCSKCFWTSPNRKHAESLWNHPQQPFLDPRPNRSQIWYTSQFGSGPAPPAKPSQRNEKQKTCVSNFCTIWYYFHCFANMTGDSYWFWKAFDDSHLFTMIFNDIQCRECKQFVLCIQCIHCIQCMMYIV